ncbi:MAG: tyrosine-type recombinase/integrase [Pseudohongiella nitratireducens]|nr:site-specific integrase [Pseudohongiella nitratireducens]MDF1623340.1 tyrosine-type recombinase/integrase [Pseudohongiella nitratireducens]
MAEKFSIRHITFSDGERYKLMVDDFGVPYYYISLFITAHVRGAALSVSTIQNTLTALKMMCLWLQYYDIDIEARFRRAELLELQEIVALRDFTKKTLAEVQQSSSKVVDLFASRRDRGVAGVSQYFRMTVIADYLGFLAETLTQHRADKELPAQIEAMKKRIRAHRPKKKGRNAAHRVDSGIDQDVLDRLFHVMTPGSPDNPFVDVDVQIRNGLIIALLRNLGIRRGELLNVRVDDIDFTNNVLKVVRRPDSAADVRHYQPLVKTRERTLPISSELVSKLSDYVLNYRNKFPKARRHPYLFVNHKAGPTQGSPLSNAGFGKLMAQIKASAVPFGSVHAHAFRHSWNYGFSQSVDKAGDISHEAEDQMRSFLMGWSPTSGTAATYNKRHIREKATEAILQYQSELNGARKTDDQND